MPSLLDRTISALVLGMISFPIIGCERHTDAQQGITIETTADFRQYFTLVDTIVLEQSDSLPIVRISGVDVREDGVIAVADASEGMVKLFQPDGRLLRVIGRKGHGPGEFQVPQQPRFDKAGILYVVDNTAQRLSVFDQEGTHLNDLPTRAFQRITDLVAMDSGTIVVSAFARDGNAHLVHQLTADGQITASFLSNRASVPPHSAEHPLWSSIHRPSLAHARGKVFVVLSLSDSLWTIDLATGQIAAESIRPQGYIVPRLPQETPANPRDLVEWTRSFSTASSVITTEDLVLVTFSRGFLSDAEPATVAARNTRDEWIALQNSPPILFARGNRIVTLDRPTDVDVVLGVYEVAR